MSASSFFMSKNGGKLWDLKNASSRKIGVSSVLPPVISEITKFMSEIIQIMSDIMKFISEIINFISQQTALNLALKIAASKTPVRCDE